MLAAVSTSVPVPALLRLPPPPITPLRVDWFDPLSMVADTPVASTTFQLPANEAAAWSVALAVKLTVPLPRPWPLIDADRAAAEDGASAVIIGSGVGKRQRPAPALVSWLPPMGSVTVKVLAAFWMSKPPLNAVPIHPVAKSLRSLIAVPVTCSRPPLKVRRPAAADVGLGADAQLAGVEDHAAAVTVGVAQHEDTAAHHYAAADAHAAGNGQRAGAGLVDRAAAADRAGDRHGVRLGVEGAGEAVADGNGPLAEQGHTGRAGLQSGVAGEAHRAGGHTQFAVAVDVQVPELSWVPPE